MACLALQDRAGVDVNLLMFALWHGVSGRGRLGRKALGRIAGAVSVWQGRVAAPLRDLRRRLKLVVENPALGPLAWPISGLRAEVKRLELEAERIEQAMLFSMAGSPLRPSVGAGARSRAARENVTRYLEIVAPKFDRGLVRELATFVDALDRRKRLKRKSDSGPG